MRTTLPTVTFVTEGRTTSPVPEFDPDWDNITALRWALASTLAREGADPTGWGIEHSNYRIGGRQQSGYYSLRYPNGSIGCYRRDAMWTLINGVGIGLRSGPAA